MSINNPLGYLDLGQLIQDSNGVITATIFDSGIYRTGTGSFRCEEHDKQHYKISRMSRTREQSIIVLKTIPITCRTLAFVGLYIGDGAKASASKGSGIISFSQRESNLSNFVRDQFINLFGPTLSFTHSVNEDALYFLTPDGRQSLINLRDQMRKEGIQIPSEHEVLASLQLDLTKVEEDLHASTKRALESYRQKRNLWDQFGKYLVEFFNTRMYMAEFLKRQKERELQETGSPLSANDRIVVNIRLPGVKGARSEGKSSRSDELNVNGLAPFRPLLLRILADVEESILLNKPSVEVEGSGKPWIVWRGLPHSYSQFTLNNEAYIRSGPSTQYVTPSGRIRRMNIREVHNDHLVMGKLHSRKNITIPSHLHFTPLISLYFGLYLAEGNTSKDKIFKFFKEPTTGLAIGFTGSEGATIDICIQAMEQLFLDEQGKVEYWRIKIGTKYFSEAAALGHKLGALVLRRGEKGQGTAGGLEIIDHVRNWSLEVIPALQRCNEVFDHLEYTGAGIPRVDIFYPNTAAPYLFALMRDLVAEPQILDDFELEVG